MLLIWFMINIEERKGLHEVRRIRPIFRGNGGHTGQLLHLYNIAWYMSCCMIGR